MSEFGITFVDLVLNVPKHKDSRRLCIKIAKMLAEDEQLYRTLLRNKNIPRNELKKRAKVHGRTIGNNRKYIIALCLILKSNLSLSKRYLEYTMEEDSMNRTGIVYDIQKNRAVVLTSESEFIIIKRRQGMNIGQQVRFENRDVFNPNRKLFLNAIAIVSAAAVFIMTFLYFQFVTLRNSGSIYGYISVDINPSVEFEIKENYRILEMRPLNEEGKQLTRELDIKDKRLRMPFRN